MLRWVSELPARFPESHALFSVQGHGEPWALTCSVDANLPRGSRLGAAGDVCASVRNTRRTRTHPWVCSIVQEAFGSASRFWTEHGYNSETGSPGYFSYVHELRKTPATSLEQVWRVRCRGRSHVENPWKQCVHGPHRFIRRVGARN